ncbi:lysine transporter LysE [Flavobacterium beibuense]|uniref:Lysine transporter LysE n=1 Tax=Flavobacterium beibuense F44-8 TaxID=1406840 RepID=A0A0A2LUQ8_9FLAO|nr:lysine transporter LysE [Flavobacterium beibuense]KGO79895.1 lysine transporter LysE [Flavobacterium beibuense F44-8]
MDIIFPVLIGILVATPGILLPGLINMTAAKISLRDGKSCAVVFAAGATFIVLIQSYIAVSFAKFISRRPDIINLLEEVGLGIFVLLTVYFIFIAKKPQQKEDEDEPVKLRSRTSCFFLGVLLSVLNFFPIPYYVVMSVTLSAYKYFSFDNLFVFLFVMGAVSSTFGVFYLYIVFFKKLENRSGFFMKNVNYFIGSVTGIVSVITLIKLLRNM